MDKLYRGPAAQHVLEKTQHLGHTDLELNPKTLMSWVTMG